MFDLTYPNEKGLHKMCFRKEMRRASNETENVRLIAGALGYFTWNFTQEMYINLKMTHWSEVIQQRTILAKMYFGLIPGEWRQIEKYC